MTIHDIEEIPDSNKVFCDTVFMEKNKCLSERWIRIGELYPDGVNQPLLPASFAREQFGQGNHYECFMLTALATLVRFPNVIQNCFISKNVRRDGRYTFQFFRGKEWVKVEIDDQIPLDEDEVLYIRSPTEHWWPLLLEKAYAKFYSGYENLEGCTLQEAYHDLTGNPVLNIPMDTKLAKAAGADVTEGHYWLDLAQKIQSGQFVGSVLTRDMDLEAMGIQREQQYGILEVFSLTGTSSVNDVVVHLHNPFEDEEFVYKGPLNSKDAQWTPKLRAKYNVDDERSIFLPLNVLLKIVNSMQLCYISQVDGDAVYFDDEWNGETAGGNPTSVTWRKNPLYYVRNTGTSAVQLVIVIKQEDQRRFTTPEEQVKYLQCGLVMAHNPSPNPIATFFISGNVHKLIFKSLFLNSREVANAITVPPNSLCYIVPSCMTKGMEGRFTLAVYRMSSGEYSNITLMKVSIPDYNWNNPVVAEVELYVRARARVDFYVDQETDIHILMHQLKPYVSRKTGGDAATQDYMGMYLYDDTDRRIGGIHAATNFRETCVLHHLPRSGRYAISITCPRGKGSVPAVIKIVGLSSSNVRIVESPEDACMFDDDDIIDEGDDGAARTNPIDYTPINIPAAHFTEVPDSTAPFEDKRFMVDNKHITNDPWVHIGDLYPEGKTQPLLPQNLSRDHFEQGKHFECCCLTAFATLADHHPDVIRNVFLTKNVRRDGRYTFQFHRYGQWVKVEIDDRIPMMEGQTLFCRSPTHHWWPLLLEKAYAKFYTLYQNIEGSTLQELYHDFTGRPVVSIPTDLKLAKSAMYDIDEPDFWLNLNKDLEGSALAATAQVCFEKSVGLQESRCYGILGVYVLGDKSVLALSDILVKLYNPFVDAVYKGPMNVEDDRWTSDLRSIFAPERRNVIYMPADTFCDSFSSIEKVLIKGVLDPSWHFNSEWGEGTNGGNPTLVTWRENPLYVIRNTSDEPRQITALICQPDQRHTLHLLPNQEMNYIQCGMVFAQSMSEVPIPTYLLTANNHTVIHKSLFLNFRETADIVIIPPKSLGYLVPSAMFHEQGRFLLSYWYMNPGDKDALTFERLKVPVARHLPAISYVTLEENSKEVVDFLVDVPTDVHILLRQEKPSCATSYSDAMTEDYLAMYLYNECHDRIGGVAAATNFRETGIVHHLENAGRYTISITCPKATGSVPSRVEVVALEEAHVRTAEVVRENGKKKDQQPKSYSTSGFKTNPQVTKEDQGHLSTSHPAARKPRLVPPPDLNISSFSFLDQEPENIPIADIPLTGDAAFVAMSKDLLALRRDPAVNASRIRELEEDMNERAHAMARQMHAKERAYLDPNPEGIPLELVPLNEDRTFREMENELRALNRKPRKDLKAIAALEDKLNDRAHDLARDLRDTEREMFLDPEPEGVPIAELPLETDSAFNEMEVQRLRLRNEGARDNAAIIQQLEEGMNKRAQELARLQLQEARSFLDPQPLGFNLEDLPLCTNESFLSKEKELRELMREPKRNMIAIRAVESALASVVYDIALEEASLDRKFLDAEPEGRLLKDLPLNDNKEFLAMDTKRRNLVRGGGELDMIRGLEEEMNEAAHEIARALNANERPDYLNPSPNGVALEDLPLDADEGFRELEARRQQLKRDPKRNSSALMEVERALNARAEELAKKQLNNDRGYLNAAPEGVPLRLLSLDTDEPFHALEVQRAQLKSNPHRNAKAIRDLEQDLNDRVHELATDLKESEREKFLDPRPNGVPIGDVPIDGDSVFQDMEIQRLLLCNDPSGNATAINNLEDAMNERAVELAARVLMDERAYLDSAPLGIPLVELSLEDNEEFMAKEADLRDLRRDCSRNGSAIAALEQDLNNLIKYIAGEELAKDREFLDPEPEGRLLAQLPLNSDKEFHALELDRRQLMKEPKKNSQKAADIEELMNERAHQLARALNAAERCTYLNPKPKGVLLDDIPLDTDCEFAKLEAKRAELMRNPGRNKALIADLEDALNLRAEELAQDKLHNERGFLYPEPQGIPLRYLPLDEDPEFHANEVQRMSLKAQNVRRNEGKIKDLEDAMNDRAEELANQMKLKGRESTLDPEPQGVPLGILPLDDDLPFTELEIEYLKAVGDGEDPSKARNLSDAMRKRSEDVASKLKADARLNLEQNPLSFALDELPLDKDVAFTEKERELLQMRNSANPDIRAIENLEEELNSIVFEMAKARAEKERDFLDPEPEGRLISELPINTDPTFLGLERQRRELKKNPYTDEDMVADLEQMMNDRAHELAKKLNAAERANYLMGTIYGIPLSDIPLDNDREFARLEAERAYLCRNPKKNASQIAALEDALHNRAEVMAAEAVRQDRIFLGEDADGVLLRHLPLDDDTEFTSLESKRAALKSTDARRNARAIEGLEEQMKDRAAELAKRLKEDQRSLLDQQPLGVPLKSLPLDNDDRFHALEENYRDLSKDSANTGKLYQILDQLNERAREMAQSLHQEERLLLLQCPEGIPLSSLPLNEDEVFIALETEARTLREATGSRHKNAGRLKELETAMNERAADLANQLRKGYCDAAPEGIPLELLGLGDIEEFVRMEGELRGLRKDPEANKEAISDLEFDLNNKAHEVAKLMLESDRAYLKPELGDLSFSVLPMNADTTFHALEVERAILKATDPHRNARRIQEIQEKLNDRLVELVEEQKAEDLNGIDREPEGIPVSQLNLHSDRSFCAMVHELRDLKKDPKRNAEAIEEIRDRMSDRAHELAQEKLRNDRLFLDKDPEGVPLDVLPLSKDPLFHKLEAERAKLKDRDPVRNAGKIRELESRLNTRAHELGKEQKKEDLVGLHETPFGLPFHVVQPHEDPKFQTMVNTLRALKKDPDASPEEIADVQQQMNDRLEELALAKLEDNRGYLDFNDLGVPIHLLPLSTDPEFHSIEVQRAIQSAQDPRRNAARIAVLEKKLNERAEQLAEELRRRELDGLDKEPEGVPLNLLDLHNNAEFSKLVDELRELQCDPEAGDKIESLKEEMNKLAHALAKEKKEQDRAFLDKVPQGVPLEILPLDSDQIFRRLEMDRAKLRAQNPRPNVRKIKELEDMLNNRCHELARDQLRSDLVGVDKLPCGIPLELLHPHDDPGFSALVDEVRELKRDPEANADAISNVIEAMNECVNDLALAQIDRGFLDNNPEGVPLEILPLDTDPRFHVLEVERVKLKLTDPRRSAKTIKELEEDMNSRAHELALRQLQEDLSGVDAAPEGIPLQLLKVTDDAEFAAMVPQLRELKKNPVENNELIRNLENRMNNRAYELADGLLEGDRVYLDPEPLGVRLADLPLCHDEVFSQMEVERAKLKAQDIRRNAAKIEELEARLNERAVELAKEFMAEDLKGFASHYSGIPVGQLKPHNDKEFASLVPELRRLKAEGPSSSLEAHMADMNRRLDEISKELVDGDLWFLDKEPEGVPREYVQLDNDKTFDRLRREREQLKAKDPRANAERIRELEEAMNDRLHELALILKNEDFGAIEKEPYGIPLALLPLRDDPIVAKIIPSLRDVMYNTTTPTARGKLRGLQDGLNNRAHELAREALVGDRDKYLDRDPEGVALEYLPLDRDPHFYAMQLERAKLKLEDPRGNANHIERLEEELNERAHELAKEQLREDLSGVDQAPHGIPLDMLKPHTDVEFDNFVKELRELKKEPRRNENKIKDLLEKMNERVNELASAVLLDDRYAHLDQAPAGVSFSELPLDTDSQFHAKEVQRAILKHKDPIKHAEQIAVLEEELNERAHELAKEQLREDLSGLDQAPHGVPLELLRPHNDHDFVSLVNELRRLKKDRRRNADAIHAVEQNMNDRVDIMAENFLDVDRTTYLDLLPLGIPLHALSVDKDSHFKYLEDERLLLLLDSRCNKEAIADLEDELNARVFQLAEERLQNDRAYLDPNPEGVSLDELPLNDDRQFHEMEVKRATLKANDSVGNAAAIAELEDELNNRAHELAAEQIAEDLRGVDAAPRGIPLALLRLHEDPEIQKSVERLRILKGDPRADPARISELEDEINNRADAIADALLHGCREKLDPFPGGIPLESLPLDEDNLFQQIELELTKLKLTDPGRNAARIADLEERLNERAADIATSIKEHDLEELDKASIDIPLSLLKPHNDTVFASLANEMRSGAKSRSLSNESTRDALIQRAKDLVDEFLDSNRDYLDFEPEGIPLSALPLSTDPEFHAMEVERAKLILTDPRRNAEKISDLEERLNDRAHALARELLSGDRNYLDPEPNGVPLKDLFLEEDALFHQMEVERAKLKTRDPVSNAYRIRDLEEKLNDRAHDLAEKIIQEELQCVEQEPKGVPLVLLHPHEDEVFASFVPELRRLKRDPTRNTAAIKNLVDKMNNRVHELATDKISKDRGLLDQEPEGIPLELLPLDTDKKFSSIEKELRALQASPRRNDVAIDNLIERLNERAHELAREKIRGDRGFLDSEPENIPLADLFLDANPIFCSMEAERTRLREKPEENAAQIAELEEELNKLAHTMAKEVKMAGREFLNRTSHGIPRDLLPLDKDRNFLGMELQLRRLKHNSHRNGPAIENLQEMMQDRADALGLQILKGDRETYLDSLPEGVDIVDVQIEEDEAFKTLELQRAILVAQDPVANCEEIRDLGDNLNNLLHELARKRIKEGRVFLDPEPEGIPLEFVPLDSDSEFKRLEAQLRKLRREARRNTSAIKELQERINDRSHELAREVVAEDLSCLKGEYRRIPKEHLNLHKDDLFKELANKRRRLRTSSPTPVEFSAVEDEMDARACEIADDVIDNERAFLDREPEGMYLADLPLDTDETFASMEIERRKRSKDPRSARRNKDIIRDLEANMNDRAHELAKAKFAELRDFMDMEPEGILLEQIPLNTDHIFKETEVARYKLLRDPYHLSTERTRLEEAMNNRAHQLAKSILEKDRGFLDQEPEGVPLSELPLSTDENFNNMERERRRLKHDSKKSNFPEVKGLEARMNERVHELARDYLRRARTFLDPEPEGVPLDDVPLARDPIFIEMEHELTKLRKDRNAIPEQVRDLENNLNDRAHEVAKELLMKERAFLDPEPLGVPLAELPLNENKDLNALERKRRTMKKDSRRNADAIRHCEDEIQYLVNEIAKEFLEKERAFLNPMPGGVPLSRLPLNTDRAFREMESDLRKLRKQPAKNSKMIEDLEEQMNIRVRDMAKEMLQRFRAFLDPEPLGVPLSEIPLDEDVEFREMEDHYREMKQKTSSSAAALDMLEEQMNEYVRHLASEVLKKERAFLDQEPEGIPLSDLPLNRDKNFFEKEKRLRALKKNPRKNAAEIKDLECDMNDRVHELARRQLSDDRQYLPLELLGVPLSELPLNDDVQFREMELQRHKLKQQGVNNAEGLREIEERLNDRALLVAEEFLHKERSYLDPEPHGISIDRLPLSTDKQFREMEQERRRLLKDPKYKDLVAELEEKLNDRVRQLAREMIGWQDAEFHEANKNVAEEWPRIVELYPEGIREAVVPERTLPSDVCSAPGCAGYLAPFIAALGRHPVLIQRLFDTKVHPVNGPYSFFFFDPNSNPVRVDIDDRVPVNANFEPKFTQVPQRSWYPLLLEKAYAKFVGGYLKLDQCTPHETLRDMTGRPVTHIPFDENLAQAANTGDFTSSRFWGGVVKWLDRGDVITCISTPDSAEGFHLQCSYALLEVILTVKDSNDPADIVIKLHNCYYDKPFYDGPLNPHDPNWTEELRRICKFDRKDEDVLYVPLPVFLRNFSSMQRCHINCGDRLSSPGEWDKYTCGGNPKFTTFRNNPIFLVENKSSRSVTILAELRHRAPVFYDAENVAHYHQTGLALLDHDSSVTIVTGLLSNATHKFIQKGIMLDTREVCSRMEIPPKTVCCLVPYTLKRGSYGMFSVSIYTVSESVVLTPLQPLCNSHASISVDIVLKPSSREKKRVDFMVNGTSDVHILLRQNKITDPKSVKKGDVIGEDEVTMMLYDENMTQLATTGDATSAREHSLAVQLASAGRYSLVLVSRNKPVTGDCPCTVLIYAQKNVSPRFVPVPSDAAQVLLPSLFHARGHRSGSQRASLPNPPRGSKTNHYK